MSINALEVSRMLVADKENNVPVTRTNDIIHGNKWLDEALENIAHWIGTKEEYEAQKDTIEAGTTVIITDDYSEAGTQHNDLIGRSAANAHPISAITGLQNALDKISEELNLNVVNAIVIDFANGEDVTSKFIEEYNKCAPFSTIIFRGNGVARIDAIIFGTPNGTNEPNKNNRTLLSDKHISIIGLGDVTLKLNNNANSDFFVFCDCEGWEFSGITFDFDLRNQSFNPDYSNWDGYSATFLCFRCKDFTFRRCKFVNSRSFEINYSKDCSGLVLDRCEFTSNDISLDTIAQKIQITDCTFAGTTRAIYFEGLAVETNPGYGWNRYIKIENTKFSLKVVGLCDYVSIVNCDIANIEVEIRDYKCFTITGCTISNASMGGNVKIDNSKVDFKAIYSRTNPTIVSSSEVSLNLNNNAFDKLIFNNCVISTDNDRIMFTANTRDQEIIMNCCDLQNKRIIFNSNARQKLQLNGCYNTNQNNNVIYPRTLVPMVNELPEASLELLYTMCILNTGLNSTLYYCGYNDNTNPSWIALSKI